MAQSEFYCDICTAPMRQISKKYVKKRRSNEKYRIRRFECTVCDFKNTIYADGKIDNEVVPEEIKEKIDKQFKQEIEAREPLTN